MLAGAAEVRGEREAAPRAALESAMSLAGLRVVVVDDEADARELLTTIFRQHGADRTVVA